MSSSETEKQYGRAMIADHGSIRVSVDYCLCTLAALTVRTIYAQSRSPESRPAFEVASVKPFDISKMSCGNCDHYGHQMDAERFVDRTSLVTYIVAAYGLEHLCMLKVAVGQDCPEIVGALPGWAKTDRWEIQAKIPTNALLPSNLASYIAREGMPTQVRLMLQTLLADRFLLKVHWESKAVAVFVLTVGKGGVKLKPTPSQGEIVKLPDGTTREQHGLFRTERVPTHDGSLRLRYAYQASSMQEAADQFSASLDRPVIDQTGLKGDFDFWLDVDWPPDAGRGLPGRFPSAGALSTALEEVGLKLESTNAPVEILVIDSLQKPSAN
jgi:uncharacterized protein (TIGR03435 family)